MRFLISLPFYFFLFVFVLQFHIFPCASSKPVGVRNTSAESCLGESLADRALGDYRGRHK